jgi:subtilisin family serine protease
MNSHRSRKSKAGILVRVSALIGLLLCAGVLTSYAAPPAPPASGANASEAVSGGLASEADAQLALPTDQIIVKYRALMAQQEAFNPASTAAMDRLSEAAGVPLTYEREMSGDAYVMSLPTRMPLAEVQAIADGLNALPEVEYAEPDAIMVPMLAPDDPQYVNQWHYFAPAPGQYGINAPAAWDITTGSSSIVVAVIDTGITNHIDLNGRTVSGYDFINDAWTANDGGGRDADPSDPGDWVAAGVCNSGSPALNSSWHGTHTAGTIGAASNNGQGVAGVNWNSKILPVRVLGRCGGYTSDIADGMRWAAGLSVSGVPANANPAKVLNLSLGGYGACDATYQDAVNAITAAGTTVVVSAGNSNADAINYRPGNCTGVITVAATNRNGGRASYSNYGATIEISAPGGDQSYTNDPNGVLSTLNTGTQGPSADTYVYYQGTSMAAPHVAGVASLLYSLKPTLTPAEVLALLQNSVTGFPSGSSCNISICGRGIVNAGAAVAALGNPVPTITRLSPFFATPGGSAFTLTVNGTGFVNGAVVRWNGENRATTYVSSMQLTAAISGPDIAPPPRTANVAVFNPAPGGGLSNVASFLIGAPKKVYLPLVVKDLPAPVLNAISNADGDGNYTVGWSAVAGATSYTLEEDDNAGFASPATQYAGAGTSWNATGKAAGTYYYRVKASTTAGSSGWSATQSTKVNPAAGWTTIVSTDFEGTWPGPWDVFDNNGATGGEYYWGKRNCRAYAGSYSGWGLGAGAQGSGLGCGANYPNSASSWMVYGPFSLANTAAAELRSKSWTYSESGYDKVCQFASINGTDYWGTCAWGDSQGWRDRVLDLSNVYTLGNLLGKPNVWIAIVFSSDASTTFAEGGYVDDIILRKCPSGVTCPAGLFQTISDDNQVSESSGHRVLPR